MEFSVSLSLSVSVCLCLSLSSTRYCYLNGSPYRPVLLPLLIHYLSDLGLQLMFFLTNLLILFLVYAV